MSNRSALMLMVSSIGVALSLASCSSDDDVVEGVGGSVAGSGGQSSSVGGSTPKSTANGGTSTSVGGAGGAVTTTSAGVAGTAPSTTGGVTGVAGSTTAAGATGLAGAGGSGGVAGGNASAGTAGVATTDIGTLCTQLCAIQSGVKDQTLADCSLGANCTSFCAAPSSDPMLTAGATAAYLAMLQCEVANFTAADYVCSTTAPVTGMRGPAPKVNVAKTTACATQICAFSCDADAAMIYGDPEVLTPCGCS